MTRPRCQWVMGFLAILPLAGMTCLGGSGGSGFPRTAAWARRTINTGAALRPTVVAAADLDADGKLDVVAGYAGDGGSNPAVVIFFQDAVDNFVPVTAASTTDLAGVIALALADLDGDGQTDIVAACNGRIVYMHSGADPRDAAGWTQSTMAQSNDAGFGQWNSVAVGDIDAANGPDIVASMANPGRVSWFRSPAANIANGTGWTRTDIAATGRTNAEGVALADFSGDGRIDVISTAPGEGADSVAWYQNPADPVNDTWTKRAIGNLAAAARVILVDLDVDSRSDVVALNTPGRQVGWYKRPVDATAAWTGAGFLLTQYTSAQPVSVAAADLNGDNQPDVVVATNNGSTLRWFIPTPGQTQTAQWLENNIADLSETIGRIALGDIDADGRPDVIAPLQAGTTAGDGIFWFENPE